MPTATGVIDDLTAFTSGRDRILIAEIIVQLDRAGFPVLMLVLVLPALIPIPGPYGMVFGTIVAMLAVQMLTGLRQPWLPAFLTRRSLPAAPLIRATRRVRGWIVWAESLHTPHRWKLLTGRRMSRLAALVILPLAVSIGLPIPFGNLLPVIAIVMIALALILRDGAALMIASAVAVLALTWAFAVLWFGSEALTDGQVCYSLGRLRIRGA